MAEQDYKYVIAGGGLAAGSAIEGIRQHDKDGSILILGHERFLPYDRPPLSKKLWTGKKHIEDIFDYDGKFYTQNGVDFLMGVDAVDLDASTKTIRDSSGRDYRFEKLLLATGGVPRKLDIPGGDLWGICYYRYLDDYIRIRLDTGENSSAVAVGGGFIGSELAASLTMNKVGVTMVFPEPYLVQRVFPESLGRSLQDMYKSRGVDILDSDLPASFEWSNGQWLMKTKNGKQVAADIVIAGLGIVPSMELAQEAGLQTGDGVVVNEFLQTSNPDIFAAGDNANFPYQALGERRRVEHWDNALNQGRYAGMNMAGAGQAYVYMPYFWSDLFEFGYEAVGDLDSRLDVFADWVNENDTGVLYYLKNNRVRGVMTCNIYGKMDEARDLIRSSRQVTPDDLRGAIREEIKAAADGGYAIG